MIPNKIFKGEQEALLLSQPAFEVVKILIESAKNRGDEKLFKWKIKDLPNKIMEQLIQTMKNGILM